MKGTWDPNKKKYVKTKKKKVKKNWVHKNNYEYVGGVLYKVGNKPYVKPKDNEESLEEQ